MTINHKTVVHGQMKRSTKKKNSQTYPSKKESIWLHDWNRAVFRRAAVYLSFCDVYATSLFTNPNRTAGPSGSDWYTAVRRCLPHQNIVCFASAQKYSLLSCLSFLINIKKRRPSKRQMPFDERRSSCLQHEGVNLVTFSKTAAKLPWFMLCISVFLSGLFHTMLLFW